MRFLAGMIFGIICLYIYDARVGDLVYCPGHGVAPSAFIVVPRGTGCEQLDRRAEYDNLDPYRSLK
jgi:hypothetical protein